MRAPATNTKRRCSH